MIEISLPITTESIYNLSAGDEIYLSGQIYTARDAAHKRMIELLNEGKPLPVSLNGQAIYYAGPCPAPPGKVIGSAGPTTSSRMDVYTPALLKEGLRVMIGKGSRSRQVIDSICKYSCVYLTAVGGAGAYYTQFIEHAEVCAFEDLGTEAIYKLGVRNMPLIVAIDYKGNSIYEKQS